MQNNQPNRVANYDHNNHFNFPIFGMWNHRLLLHFNEKARNEESRIVPAVYYILSSEGVRGGSGVFRKSKDRKRFLANYLEVLTAQAQLSVSAMVRKL